MVVVSCVTARGEDALTTAAAARRRHLAAALPPPCRRLAAAAAEALSEMVAEGGVAGRYARYAANAAALQSGMAELGFTPYLDADKQGCIITTYLVPDDAAWDFDRFYTEV